jgi:hypothetical protein
MEKKSTVFTLDFANTRADQILRAHRRQHLLDCIEQAKFCSIKGTEKWTNGLSL